MRDPSANRRRRTHGVGGQRRPPHQGARRGGGHGKPRAAQGRSTPKRQLPDNLVYGINPVAAALETGQLKVLFFGQGAQSEPAKHLHASSSAAGIDIRPLEEQGWHKVLPAEQHQGVAGILHPPPKHYLEEILEDAGDESCILVLDRVQDPQNLGAVLRTAAATGVDAVLLPKAGGCPITPAVHKASAGMSMKVRIVEDENLAGALKLLKEYGYWAVGCDSADGEDATSFEFPRKLVIVMGGEGGGMRRLIRENCDYLVRIPMAGGVESLNISVAAGVVLYLAKAVQAKDARAEPGA